MSARRAPALVAALRDAVTVEGDLLRQLRTKRTEISHLLLDARSAGLPYRVLARGLVEATGNPASTERSVRRAERALRERHRRARLEDTQRGAIPLPSPGADREGATSHEVEVPLMTKNTPVISEIQIPVRRTTTTVVEEFVEIEDLGDDREPDDDRDDDRPSPKRRGSR